MGVGGSSIPALCPPGEDGLLRHPMLFRGFYGLPEFLWLRQLRNCVLFNAPNIRHHLPHPEYETTHSTLFGFCEANQ
jgi:hypothetical protein